MKKITTLLTFILAVFMLSVVFSACSDSGKDTSGAQDSSADESDPASNDTAFSSSTQGADSAESSSEPAETEAPEASFVYETIENPIAQSANDPWVIEHEGSYYYCFSRNNGVAVARMDSPLDIGSARASQVYSAPSGTMYSNEYWAPELHYLQGEWYIYVAADDGNNSNHRMYVLRGTSQDPTEPFEMVGKITDPSDRWAIDGTVLTLNDELYFVWSGWEGTDNVAQNIYIAHMSDPCTIDSERVLISSPTYSWEKVGTPYVNEGPAALCHDGKTFIVYSASGSWTDNYCLGMLTLEGEDPLDAESWSKSKLPVFRARAGVAYGPGHCCFTTAIDGSIWMLYHANLVSGTGWNGRNGWIAPVLWDEDGNPDFGKPSETVNFPVGTAQT